MRQLYRLSARKIPSLTKPGRYPDGFCLYLQIGNGGRSWIMRYRAPNGRVREMGLGSAKVISLQQAREARDAAYGLLKAGIDPLKEKASKSAIAGNARTFGDFATEYLKLAITGFRNEKHKWQWRQTLEKYCKPIRKKFLADITTADVFGCLDPIWDNKNETARRLRGRIERVLSAAKAQGLREGENPASWENLKPLFEGRKKPVVTHHPALPYKEAPAFMRQLRKLTSTSALCAGRSGEVRLARWHEFDLDAKKWTVPAGRMKANKDHEVPLSDRAVAILQRSKPGKPHELVFKGTEAGEPLSETALLKRDAAGKTIQRGVCTKPLNRR
jgi:integrase